MNNYKEKIEKKYQSIATIPEGLMSFTKEIRRIAIRHMDLQEGDRVIDVGCGTGASFPFLEDVIGQSGTIFGVEPSSTMINGALDRINQEKWENITLVESTIEEIDVRDEFDGALLFAMHDVFNSPEGLEKLHLLLKEGARIVCVGPKIQQTGFTRLFNPFLKLLFQRMAISQENMDQPWRLIEKIFVTESITYEKHGLIFIYVGKKQFPN